MSEFLCHAPPASPLAFLQSATEQPGEQHGCRLMGRVLLHQAPFESSFQDGLPQSTSCSPCLKKLFCRVIGSSNAFINEVQRLYYFRRWWDRNWEISKNFSVDLGIVPAVPVA